MTQPDRPAGRGRAPQPPPVKVAATDLDIPVLQPETLSDPEVMDRLRAERPDVLVVVAYGELLRREVLELAPLGAVNVHPSLLPKYRGATPIPAAILAGDIMTGVSIIRLTRRLDAGPVLAQRSCLVEPDDTTGSLGERLAILAAEMLPQALLDYAAGRVEPVPQDDDLATYTRELTSSDARIDWSRSAVDIERLVRASMPWPVAWTTFDDTRLRVLSASVADAAIALDAPGTVRSIDGHPAAATGDGWLRLDVVQPSGKRPMPAADWLRGVRSESLRLGEPASAI